MITAAQRHHHQHPPLLLPVQVDVEAVGAAEVARWTNGLLVAADRLRVGDRHGTRAEAETVPLLKQAATAGDCRAMHRLGSMYLTGEWKPTVRRSQGGQGGVLPAEQVGSAVVWMLGKAGRAGCADADGLAGHFLATGLGSVAHNRTAAKLHYVAAALRGSLDGHAALGRLYLFGAPAVQPDAGMALMHYSWAARRALADLEGSALPFTETVRLSEAMQTGLAGHGGKDDEMLQWVQLNADNGNPQALMTIGRCADQDSFLGPSLLCLPSEKARFRVLNWTGCTMLASAGSSATRPSHASTSSRQQRRASRRRSSTSG